MVLRIAWGVTTAHLPDHMTLIKACISTLNDLYNNYDIEKLNHVYLRHVPGMCFYTIQLMHALAHA